MEAAALPRLEPARPALSPRLWRLTTDHQLVEMIRLGQDGAFEALYDRHHRAILSFCRHMLSDPHEAEDAVQHTFLAAYRELSYTSKEINVRPWLFTIARNRCYSMLRARREQPTDEFDQIATEGFTAEVQQREDLRQILRDMSKLPEEQRAALVMSELDALTHAEIGDILGVRTDKVKALVFQARSSLVASKTARETPCSEIRMELAEGRGAALRRANLRRHLRECDGCREFRIQVEGQRHGLRLLLPVVPSLALKEVILGAAVVGGGTAAVGGGAVLSGAVKGGALKGIFALLAVSAGTAGTAIVVSHGDLPLGSGFPTMHRALRLRKVGAGHTVGSVSLGHVTRATTGGHGASSLAGTSHLSSLGQFALPAPKVSVAGGKVQAVHSSATASTFTPSLPPLAPTSAGTSLPPLAPGTSSAAAGPTGSLSSTAATTAVPTAAGVTPTASADAPAAAPSSSAASSSSDASGSATASSGTAAGGTTSGDAGSGDTASVGSTSGDTTSGATGSGGTAASSNGASVSPGSTGAAASASGTGAGTSAASTGSGSASAASGGFGSRSAAASGTGTTTTGTTTTGTTTGTTTTGTTTTSTTSTATSPAASTTTAATTTPASSTTTPAVTTPATTTPTTTTAPVSTLTSTALAATTAAATTTATTVATAVTGLLRSTASAASASPAAAAATVASTVATASTELAAAATSAIAALSGD